MVCESSAHAYEVKRDWREPFWSFQGLLSMGNHSPSSRITSVIQERKGRAMNGLKRKASRIVGSILISTFLMSTIGAASASASSTSVPRHGASISCLNWYEVDVTGYMFGFTYGNESVAWFPVLQRWQGGRWIDLTAWNLQRWHVGAANRSFAPQAEGWSVHKIPVVPGYHYRLKSWHYWYTNGYQTPAEYTSSCYVGGIVIA